MERTRRSISILRRRLFLRFDGRAKVPLYRVLYRLGLDTERFGGDKDRKVISDFDGP